MPDVNIMVWNIETFGAAKYGPANGGDDLIDMIGSVAMNSDATIVALLEISSNLGNTIGQDLAQHLDNLSPHMGANWQWDASPQLSTNFEQYLFLWDSNQIHLGNAPNSFQWQFVDPAAAPALLGFPRQAATDRPPYLGYFVADPGGVARDLRVAIMHSPGPGYWFAPRNAARQMARVAEFAGGDMCVIMGDLNIRWSADQSVANSYGAAAFTNLVNAGYTQAVPQALTSLKDYHQAFVGMTIHDCYSQPYDQIFVRNNPNVHAIGYSDEGFEELIVECYNGAPFQGILANIEAARTGALPAANYPAVEDAFAPFSHYVSDHMPIFVTITV